MRKTRSPYIIVRKSGVHGKGVFAKKDIPKGMRIIEYVGKKVTKNEAERIYDKRFRRVGKRKKKGFVYLFELNKKYDIDGNVKYNTAKWINHSCTPNCETEIIDGKIWVVSIKNIRKGEELSYNYGYNLEDFEDHPCRCGSKRCVGYILAEEYWPELKKILKKRKY